MDEKQARTPASPAQSAAQVDARAQERICVHSECFGAPPGRLHFTSILLLFKWMFQIVKLFSLSQILHSPIRAICYETLRLHSMLEFLEAPLILTGMPAIMKITSPAFDATA